LPSKSGGPGAAPRTGKNKYHSRLPKIVTNDLTLT